MVTTRTGIRNSIFNTLSVKPGPGYLYPKFNSSSGKKRQFIFRSLLLNLLLVFTSLASHIEAQNLYAVSNGNWDSPTTWSDSPGGPSGFGIPNANTNIHISEGVTNYTVNMNVSGSARSVTIYSGGKLFWNAAIPLSIYNNGTFTIQSGGSTDANNLLAARIRFMDNGAYLGLIVDDLANGLNIGRISLRGGVTLDISGSGNIEILNDLGFFGDNATVNNDFSGTFSIGDDLDLHGSSGEYENITFNNYRTISRFIAGFLFLGSLILLTIQAPCI